MTTFIKDETVIVKGTVKDPDGTLVNMSAPLNITILDPIGSAVVDNQLTTSDIVGRFRYLYNPNNPVIGAYHVRVVGSDIAIPRSKFAREDSEFFLVD